MSLAEELENTFEYSGKEYTTESFAIAFGVDMEQVEAVIAVLEKQGKIRYPEEEGTDDKNVLNALKQVEAFKDAQAVEQDTLNEVLYKQEQKREGEHIYEKVEFTFGSMGALKEFRASVKNMHLECETVLDEEERQFKLRVLSLSAKELTALSNLYKMNKAVKATVNTTTKAFDSALKTTDYAARNVVVPVAKIGLSGMFSIGKSLVGTATKIGGIAVSEAIKTTRETTHSIKTDDSIAVAKAELYRTKNEIKSSLSKKSKGGNGIKIG